MIKQDYIALQKAKQIVENTIYKSGLFGKNVTLINGAWDSTDKACIGVYEAASTVNMLDRKEVNTFIEDSSNYLNTLNEKLHLEGYHFDLTGSTSGNLYIARDRKYIGEMYISDGDESTYMQECAYRQYLINKNHCQNSIQNMLKESLIITDEQLSISEKVDNLLSINEGIGDSLSNAWDKFKAFIRKMFNKFLEFISRTTSSDKNYLDKYKDLILHREYQLDPLDIDGEYEVGVRRLSTFQIQIPSAQDVQSWPSEDNDQNLKTVQAKIMPEYSSNTGLDFSEWAKHHFKGGDGKGGSVTLDKGRVNLANMYNFCYNFDKIEKALKKNQSNLDSAVTVFKNYVKEKFEKVKNAVKPGEAAKPTSPTNTGTTVTAATVSGGKDNSSTSEQPEKVLKLTMNPKISINTILKAKFDNYKKQYEAATTPAEKNKIVTTAQKEGLAESVDMYKNKRFELAITETVVTSGSSSGGGGGSAPGNFGNLTNGAGAVRDRAGAGTVNTDDGDEGLKKFDIQTGFFTKTANAIFGAMLTAAETIKKDYMKIIRMHVKSYVGETDTEARDNKTAAKSMSNYATGVTFSPEQLKAAGIQGGDTIDNLINTVTKQIEELKQKPNDETVKNNVNTLINQVSNINQVTNDSGNTSPVKQYANLDAILTDLKEYKRVSEAKAQQNTNQQQTGNQQQPTEGQEQK